jgi:hypothetical protein
MLSAITKHVLYGLDWNAFELQSITQNEVIDGEAISLRQILCV